MYQYLTWVHFSLKWVHFSLFVGPPKCPPPASEAERSMLGCGIAADDLVSNYLRFSHLNGRGGNVGCTMDRRKDNLTEFQSAN